MKLALIDDRKNHGLLYRDLAKKYGINTSNLGDKSSKLGFKFSWEDGDYGIKDITKEVNKLN